MIKKIMLSATLLIFGLILVSCGGFLYQGSSNKFKHGKKSFINQIVMQRTKITKSFNKVNVSDNINVEIIAGKNRQTVDIVGTKKAINGLIKNVNGSTLNLQFSEEFVESSQERVLVKINMKRLNQITRSGNSNVKANNINSNLVVKSLGSGDLTIRGNKINLHSLLHSGSGNVDISKLASSALNIDTQGPGNINLFGEIALNTLSYKGSGRLNLYWVNSKTVTILAQGSGYLQLAGITQWLHADISDSIHLNVRFLRANIGNIHTIDTARADVWVKHRLYTFTTNYSNVYYYTKPRYLYADNRQSGTVLAMHDVPSALITF